MGSKQLKIDLFWPYKAFLETKMRAHAFGRPPLPPSCVRTISMAPKAFFSENVGNSRQNALSVLFMMFPIDLIEIIKNFKIFFFSDRQITVSHWTGSPKNWLVQTRTEQTMNSVTDHL